MTESISFPSIITHFNVAISALNTLAAQISSAADNFDKVTLSKIVRDIGYIFNEDSEGLERELLQIFEESDVEIESVPTEEKLAEMKSLQDQLGIEAQKLAQVDPDKARRLAFAMSAFMKQPPAQGRLLRRSALIMLVAHFEQLLAELIFVYYTQNPNELPPGRQLSLAELRSIGSVDEAEAFLISREADQVIRGRLDDHLRYFKKTLKVELKTPLAVLDDLREVFLRRNLLVHTNGRVNKEYLSKAGETYLQTKQIKEGLYLHADSRYLQRAITAAHISGLILIHQCWRNWAPQDKHGAANQSLAGMVYDALVDGKYEIVEALAEFAHDFGLPKPLRNAVTINYAIALRDTSRVDEVPQVLKQIKPTSPPDGKVAIALAVLNGDYDAVLLQLPEAVANGTLDRFARYWPLFKPIKDDPRFIAAFGD